MRLIGRRLSQKNIAIGLDKVVSGFPLPSDGVLNAIHLEQHLISPEGNVFNSMAMYGTTIFVIPVMDPDGGASYDAIWDAQVPKDVALTEGAFDLDTGASDTTAEFEIGLPDISAIMQMSALEPIEIFRRRKFMTLASGNALLQAATPDTIIFTDHYSTRIGRKVRVPSPSVVLIGTSAPDALVTTATVKVIPSEAEWMLLRFLEVALEQAFMSLAGLLETGAESPYEESLAFIAKLIEDTVIEDIAGAFASPSWAVFTRATYDISVPGRIGIGTLTSE